MQLTRFIRAKFLAHQSYKHTISDLGRLTNRELQDMGISRSDIFYIADQAARKTYDRELRS